MLKTLSLQFRKWGQKSPRRGILVATITVGLLTLLVKSIAFLKDLLVAYNFGVSSELDAYLVAFIVPSFAMNVIAGSFHTSLVPTYIEVRNREGKRAAQDLLSAVTARTLLIMLGCMLVLMIAEPLLLPLLASGFNSATYTLAQQMFFITLPAIVIGGTGVLWGAVLNSYNHFALAAIAPAFAPAATMIFLIFLYQRLGIHTLALGLMVGFSLQAGVLGWALHRHGISLHPNLQVKATGTRQVMEQFWPAAAGAVLLTSTELVDQAMAARLGEGSVSALNFGIKLVAFAIAISSTGLGVSVLTYFSNMVADRNWTELRRTYKVYTFLIIAATIPVILLFAIFSEPIVQLLYERGAFAPEDTTLVSRIQVAFSFQLPFYLLVTLTARLLASLKMQKAFFWGALLNLSTNIILNVIFTRWLGVAGIALSTSAVHAISFTYLFLVLFHTMRRLEREANTEPEIGSNNA